MIASDHDGMLSGVQAQHGAGTPPHLEVVADGGTLAALELPAALALVASHAAGPLGAARIMARRPSVDQGWIRRELDQVAQVLALFRRGDRLQAMDVPEIATAMARLRVEGGVLEAADLLAVHHTVAAAREVAGELRRVAEAAPATQVLLADLPPEAVTRRLRLSVDETTGELLDGASPELAAARREVHAARERLLRKLEGLLRSLDPQAVPAGAAVTIREGRYVIPVRRDSRARPAGIVHDESASAGTLFLEPTAAVELGNALRAALTDERQVTVQVYRELTALLRPERERLLAAHAMCVAVDDLVARARYTHSCGAEVPALAADDALALRGARHPLLVARMESVVPFDLVLPAGARTVLISGPNTGGKTVVLKTTGLVMLLVQSGVVPPVGAGTVVPVFRRVVADIGDHQSIAADLSTFSAHLVQLRRVLIEADDRTLVLLDEIGGGTDPAEGAALAAAALRALTARGTVTMATTHLGALKTLAARTEGIVNGSLHFDTATLSPTYRFQLGVPGRSYGLAIARRLGVEPAVLAEAEVELPAAERALEALLGSVEERDRELRERLRVLEEREREADLRSQAFVHQAEAIAAREREVAGRERTAERRAREEARALLLAARGEVDAALAAAARAAEETAATEARRLVEEAIRRQGDAITALDAAAAEPSGPAQPVGVGRRVRTSAGAVGRVAEVRGDGRLVVTAGTVRLVVPADAVAPLAEPASEPPALSRHREPPAGGGPMEIDLRGYRADEAAIATLAALDAAILAEHPHLQIIHGMGTGAVRDRVRELLRRDRRVARFDFAPRAQGGTGVTIAEFQAP